MRKIAESFRDHWSAKPGKDATKLDWEATWRNWCKSGITQRDYPPPRAGANGHHPPDRAAARAAKNAEAEALAFGGQPQEVASGSH